MSEQSPHLRLLRSSAALLGLFVLLILMARPAVAPDSTTARPAAASRPPASAYGYPAPTTASPAASRPQQPSAAPPLPTELETVSLQLWLLTLPAGLPLLLLWASGRTARP